MTNDEMKKVMRAFFSPEGSLRDVSEAAKILDASLSDWQTMSFDELEEACRKEESARSAAALPEKEKP